MAEASQRALEFDTSLPNIARMYDYWLGGKDNFAAWRADDDPVTNTSGFMTILGGVARKN